MNDDPMVWISAELEVNLPVSGVFPDGIPETWTAEDILAVIRESGSLTRWISDWSIEDNAYISVEGRPGDRASGGLR